MIRNALDEKTLLGCDGMKRLVVLIALVAFVLVGCSKPEMAVSFSKMDFGNVTQVRIQNAHNGVYSFVSDTESVDAICAYLKGVSGGSGESGKGYYEGTYEIALYSEDGEIVFSLAFGDENVFYCGEGKDGYPIRYHLTGLTIEDTTAFFRQYDNSVADER